MKPYTILIIEDHYLVAQRLADQVSQLHHTPIICTDPTTLTPSLMQSMDLALVDIVLHDEYTGIAVAQNLREQHKPFIFVTGVMSENILHQAMGVFPACILLKPVDTRQLGVSIAAAMHTHTIVGNNTKPGETLTVAELQKQLQYADPSKTVCVAIKFGNNGHAVGKALRVENIEKDDSAFPRGSVVLWGE